MERLSDYLVFCDMDNTLLTAKEGIPACNRSVIRLFTAMGGRFTVASGRSRSARRWAISSFRCQQSPAMVRCCMISRPTVYCVAPA